MTDERRARQMVQYHIEGEHVFPEPECPSCRAERVGAALERVQKLQDDAPWWAKNDPWLKSVAGWAGAIQALNTVAADGKCGYCGQPIEAFPDGTDYCACTTKRPCRHRYFTRPSEKKCAACNVIDPFITDMLGGDDEQH